MSIHDELYNLQEDVRDLLAENTRLKELNREMVVVIKKAQNELAFLHANDGRFGFAEILNEIKDVLGEGE